MINLNSLNYTFTTLKNKIYKFINEPKLHSIKPVLSVKKLLK